LTYASATPIMCWVVNSGRLAGCPQSPPARQSERGFMKSANGPGSGVVANSLIRPHLLLLPLSLILCIPAVMGGQSASAGASLPLLTRVEQIRTLKLEDADRGYPVRIRGVVTYFDPDTLDFFVQDSTGGIWVDLGNNNPGIHFGQLVEVEGLSAAPDFAPQIAKPHFRVLGSAPLPVARRVTYNALASTKEDSQWVEVEGIIHRAWKDGNALLLDMAMDGGHVTVRNPSFAGSPPASFVDSKVRIDGVCGAIFNQKNQMIGVAIYPASLDQIHTIEPAVDDPYQIPLRPIVSLLRFNPLGSSGHRVRVKGIVTLQNLGTSLFIKDENSGLYIHTPETAPVRVGDLVEAVGFPSAGEYSAVLQDAIFRRISAGPIPSPISVTAAQALDGSHDADFVSIEGRLLEGGLGPGPHTLTMESGDRVFQVEMLDAQPQENLKELTPGSLLGLTGICIVLANENHVPQGFRLLVPSVDGVAVRQPAPWWSIRHLFMIIALMAAVVMVFGIWTSMLNRQVTHKTKIIREGLERETAARERYQELFDNATDMVFTCDAEGRFLSMNKAGRTMIEVGPNEALNTSLGQILAPEYMALARQILRRTNQEGQGTYEVEILTKDKGRLNLELATRLVQRKGQPVEIEGIGRNTTRRRRLEAQLRQAQKMEAVGRLAGGVAHDFNNLLTVISGFGQLVLGRLDRADPKCQHMAEILKASDRAAALTQQLLAFSRQQVLQPQVLDLNVTMANTASLLRRTLGEDIELSIIPGHSLGRVKADPGEIDRAIMNLAVNARDAMPHGGTLTIRTDNVSLDESYARLHYSVPPGEYVQLSVTDTGCGMDAETQRHLFEPFFTTKDPGKGTGLGLATVHGIVKQSGGHITVYSEVGHGTCFKIYFPRVDEVTKPSPEPGALEEHRGGTETILLVEDEAMVRDLAQEVLKDVGYTVIAVDRPDEALEISEQNKGPIDLVLTDVVMPGMSGPELVKRLKPKRPDIKVLYVSGYAADALVRHGLPHSKSAFLQKPFAPAALVRKVREVLTKAGEHRAA